MAEPITVGVAVGALLTAAKPVIEGLVANLLTEVATNNDVSVDEEEARLAVTKAYETWLESIVSNLDAAAIMPEHALQKFEASRLRLHEFLGDEEVQLQLLRPFDEMGHAMRLESDVLKRKWSQFELPWLDDINFLNICRRYVAVLGREQARMEALRPVLLARLAQSQASDLGKLVGHWPDFNLAKYSQRFRDKYRVLELSAITPPEREKFDQINLRDVFIPQNCRSGVPIRDLPKDYLVSLVAKPDAEGDVAARLSIEENVREGPVLDLLADRPAMVILGDPGSGKSTLMRDLCLRCLDSFSGVDDSGDWFADFRGRLPLLIELRHYVAARSDAGCKSVIEYLHHLGKSQGYGLTSVDTDAMLREERTLIVFDGLDEVLDPAMRAKITEEMIGFRHDYPKSRVIVTSRIFAYRRDKLEVAGFDHFTLNDLDDEQIELFIKAWYGRIFKGKPDEAESRMERVREALARSPAVRALAGNPLILTIIAIVARSRTLPRDRSRLYAQALSVFVHHWDATAKLEIGDLPTGDLDEDDKIALLCEIAGKMSDDRDALATNVITEDDLEKIITQFLEQKAMVPQDRARPMARKLIEQLRERNFVLCVQGPELYGFMHRSFLDYLVAFRIVSRFEKTQEIGEEELYQLAREHTNDEVWAEILKLLCGMLSGKFAGNLVETIAGAAEPERLVVAVDGLCELKDVAAASDVFQSVRQQLEILTPKDLGLMPLIASVTALTKVSGRPLTTDWLRRCDSAVFEFLPDLIAAFAGINDRTLQALASRFESDGHSSEIALSLARNFPDNEIIDSVARDKVDGEDLSPIEHDRWVYILALRSDINVENSNAVRALIYKYPERFPYFYLKNPIFEADILKTFSFVSKNNFAKFFDYQMNFYKNTNFYYNIGYNDTKISAIANVIFLSYVFFLLKNLECGKFDWTDVVLEVFRFAQGGEVPFFLKEDHQLVTVLAGVSGYCHADIRAWFAGIQDFNLH